MQIWKESLSYWEINVCVCVCKNKCVYKVEVVFVDEFKWSNVGVRVWFWVQAACFGPLFSQCIDISLATHKPFHFHSDAWWSEVTWPNPLPLTIGDIVTQSANHKSPCDWLIHNRNDGCGRSPGWDLALTPPLNKHWLSCGNWIVWILNSNSTTKP